MMPRVIRKLAAPFHYLCAWICVLLASRLKPHSSALKEFGIRVVAPKDYGSQDNHGDVYTALVLLKQFDEDEFNLIKKNIRTIFLHDMYIFGSSYQPTGQICFLDIRKLSGCPSGTVPIAIAGYLVYFASLAKFKKSFWSWIRINERISAEEKQQQVVDKLLKFFVNERF
jgi:hypothetical protein